MFGSLALAIALQCAAPAPAPTLPAAIIAAAREQACGFRQGVLRATDRPLAQRANTGPILLNVPSFLSAGRAVGFEWNEASLRRFAPEPFETVANGADVLISEGRDLYVRDFGVQVALDQLIKTPSGYDAIIDVVLTDVRPRSSASCYTKVRYSFQQVEGNWVKTANRTLVYC